jgi:hypothetical protein
VKYELAFYIPEDNILHSHRRENLKSYIEEWKHPQLGAHTKQRLGKTETILRGL